MANKIHEIIKESGIKTTFVIKKAGLSKSAFYSIANGDSIPSLISARKISNALGKSIEEVFPEIIGD